MKQIVIFLIGLLMAATTLRAQAPRPFPLMPYPASVTAGIGAYTADSAFSVSYSGPATSGITAALAGFHRRLTGRTGLFLGMFSPTPSPGAPCRITVQTAATARLGTDESYTLTVTEAGISIAAPTDIGARYALETLLQLLQPKDGTTWCFPAVTVTDSPRFPWRGLMIDVSRHFMPVEVLKRNLDALAAVKMNVFHWHLTDDQGFRMECKSFPKLHQLGSDGLYFTHEQIREIITYAADRGIRVIPEFDLPGHATSWFVGHPELASAPGPYTIERRWGIFDSAMDPSRDETYAFLDAFFAEVASLFPDEYIHIGGDENNGKQWDASPSIAAFKKANSIADNHQLQAYFNNRLLAILKKYNRKMIGWDEILQPGLPNDIVIQSWRGTKALTEAAHGGFMGILSNGYYIDLCQPASFHYLNDPLPEGSSLTPVEQQRILGGEATSWAELVTWETVDSRIWPRTAAIAERFWSPREVRQVEDMYARLSAISLQLEEHGITHIKNYEMLLRRLAGTGQVAPLRVLVDVLEPVKGYKRHFQGVTYTSYSPYTRAADAARPESDAAREFTWLVRRFIAGKADKEALIALLEPWAENEGAAFDMLTSRPALRELFEHSANLAQLSRLALVQLREGATGLETAQLQQILENARAPRGQVELAVVPGFCEFFNITLVPRP